MKKLALITTVLTSILFLHANELLGFETNLTTSEYLSINKDIISVIKKDSLKRNFIPGENKKIISEKIDIISSDGTEFTYKLNTVSLSGVFNYQELTPFYSEVYISGKIKSIFKDAFNNYEIFIETSTESSVESYNYYGPKNTKDIRVYSRNKSFKISFNPDTIQNMENEDNLYFVGITRKFTSDELKNLTLDELGYLRNEFYARQGFIFKTTKMKNYFITKPWFKPTTRDVTLSETVLANVYLIRGMEQEINFGSNLAEVDELNRIYEVAQLRPLTKVDIENISSHKIPYLRNTFFAKKGFIFSVLRYKDYFEVQSWYVGSEIDVDNKLTELDKKNIAFIKSNESES